MDCARADRMPVPTPSRLNGFPVRDDPTPIGGGANAVATAWHDDEDWRDVAISSNADEVYPEQFLLHQKAYLDRLCALHHHGLSLASVLVLVRTWSQGAPVHILRHVVVQKAWSELVDQQLVAAFEHLLDAPETVQRCWA